MKRKTQVANSNYVLLQESPVADVTCGNYQTGLQNCVYYQPRWPTLKYDTQLDHCVNLLTLSTYMAHQEMPNPSPNISLADNRTTVYHDELMDKVSNIFTLSAAEVLLANEAWVKFLCGMIFGIATFFVVSCLSVTFTTVPCSCSCPALSHNTRFTKVMDDNAIIDTTASNIPVAGSSN